MCKKLRANLEQASRAPEYIPLALLILLLGLTLYLNIYCLRILAYKHFMYWDSCIRTFIVTQSANGWSSMWKAFKRIKSCRTAYSLERASSLPGNILYVTLGKIFCLTMLLNSSDPSSIRKISYQLAT